MRAIQYSHDGSGLGHVRRNLADADALTQLDGTASALLVCSIDQVDSLVIPPRVDVHKLPGVRRNADAGYGLRDILDHPRTVAAEWQAGRVLSQVWGYDYDPGPNIVDVYVGNLRRKIGKQVVQTVRGMGYRLQP